MDVNFPDPFVRTTLISLKTVSKPTNHNTLLSSRKRKISLGVPNFCNLSKHGPVLRDEARWLLSLLLFAKTSDLIIIIIIIFFLEKAALHISDFM